MILLARGANLKLYFEHWPLVWLWPISLVLMQVTLWRVGTFELTLAFVIVHLMQLLLLMLYWVNRPSDLQVTVTLGAVLYALLLGLSARDGTEFGKSLAQVLNLAVMALICLNARLERRHEVGRSLAVFCVAAAAAGLLIIAQALAFNLWRDFQLANLLGPFAPLGPGGEVYEPSPLALLPRANGLYSEPSVAGWFMSFAVALALAARRLYPLLTTLTAGICALAAMATLSLTGVLGSAIVLAGYILFVRDRLAPKLLWLMLAGGAVALAIYHAHQLGILARFHNIHMPGTSIYFRLSAPYALIGESLERFPLGYALGQTDFIASRPYYINWENGSQTNIDNTLFMIVFYFGVLGILCNVTYLLQLARYLLLKRHAVGLIMLSLLIGLATTGAGWAHHFVLMIGYAILVGRYLRAEPQIAPRLTRPRLAALTRLRSDAWRAPARRPAARPRAAWP